MRDTVDRDLEALIRVTLRSEAAAAAVGAGMTVTDIERIIVQRRRARSRRRPLLLLGLAAVLATTLAVAGAGLLSPSPAPTGTVALLTRTVGGEPPDAEVAVVAVARDGRERELSRFPMSLLGDGRYLEAFLAAPDGRLALGAWTDDGGADYLIVDLAHPEATPIPVPGIRPGADGDAFGPDGRFASTDADGIVVVDLATGDRTHLPIGDGSVPHGGLRWTADGTGFLVGGDPEGGSIYDGVADPGDPGWRILSIDGSARDGAPDGLAPMPWVRLVTADGSRLQVCRSADGVPCPDLPDGAVVVQGPDGAVSTWYRDELAPARVRSAGFAADERLIWVLGDQQDEARSLQLARVDPSGSIVIANEIPAPATFTSFRLDGFAEDDSLAVIGASGDEVVASIVVPTDGSPASSHEGLLIGFAPAAEVETWTGGDWRSVELLAEEDGALPRLPTRDELTARTMGEPVLAILEHEAVAGRTGSIATEATVAIAEGIGVVAACVGAGVVEIRLGDNGPDVIDCLGGDVVEFSVPNLVTAQPLRVTATGQEAASWRVVLFDPPVRRTMRP